MAYTFWVENDNLCAADAANGLLWRGRPDGEAALKVVPLPDQDDCVVLLNYRAYQKGLFGSSRNVVRCSPAGTVVWQAELPFPTQQDCYTDVNYSRNLVASTWSAYSVTLDAETGRVLAKVFTK